MVREHNAKVARREFLDIVGISAGSSPWSRKLDLTPAERFSKVTVSPMKAHRTYKVQSSVRGRAP